MVSHPGFIPIFYYQFFPLTQWNSFFAHPSLLGSCRGQSRGSAIILEQKGVRSFLTLTSEPRLALKMKDRMRNEWSTGTETQSHVLARASVVCAHVLPPGGACSRGAPSRHSLKAWTVRADNGGVHLRASRNSPLSPATPSTNPGARAHCLPDPLRVCFHTPELHVSLR